MSYSCVEPTFGYPVYSAKRRWSIISFLYEAAGGAGNALFNAKVVDIMDNPGSPL